MACLEDLKRGASVKGVLPDGIATVVDVKWHDSAAVELTYKDAAGRVVQELLYRDSEPSLEVVQTGRPWSFDGAVSLNADRVGRDAGQIAESVIQHLAGQVGANVEVTLEIHADIPDGAPDHVVRTMTENCNTLKFRDHGFEDE